jgi:hypothetical protein
MTLSNTSKLRFISSEHQIICKKVSNKNKMALSNTSELRFISSEHQIICKKVFDNAILAF